MYLSEKFVYIYIANDVVISRNCDIIMFVNLNQSKPTISLIYIYSKSIEIWINLVEFILSLLIYNHIGSSYNI